MRWYRIEFYDKEHAPTKSAHAFAIVHRIAMVERQYSTQRRAQAAAGKMARYIPNCKQYDVTPL